jgi:DNA (cytosine-5)-methyltransferase 1
MWPATFATIRIVRPKYVFLENVPGLLSAGQNILLIALEKIRQFDLFGARNPKSFTGSFVRHIIKTIGPRYLGRVLGDLASIGYDAEWTVLGADDVGAPHRRKRLWVLAYRDGE